MEKYMPEQICPYCNHFYDCQCRSKAGSCHDWILDSGYEHLIGLIEIDDLVLSTDHPDCVPYKAAAERDQMYTPSRNGSILRCESSRAGIARGGTLAYIYTFAARIYY